MNRRETLGIPAAAFIWPALAPAQQPNRLPVAGLLMAQPSADTGVDYFRSAMRKLQSASGRNYALEVRTALGRLLKSATAAELPVERLSKLTLVVKVKTAKRLGERFRSPFCSGRT